MSAHTCFVSDILRFPSSFEPNPRAHIFLPFPQNALDLPVYNSEEEMKDKLLYAISEGSGGFGFA